MFKITGLIFIPKQKFFLGANDAVSEWDFFFQCYFVASGITFLISRPFFYKRLHVLPFPISICKRTWAAGDIITCFQPSHIFSKNQFTCFFLFVIFAFFNHKNSRIWMRHLVRWWWIIYSVPFMHSVPPPSTLSIESTFPTKFRKIWKWKLRLCLRAERSNIRKLCIFVSFRHRNICLTRNKNLPPRKNISNQLFLHSN